MKSVRNLIYCFSMSSINAFTSISFTFLIYITILQILLARLICFIHRKVLVIEISRLWIIHMHWCLWLKSIDLNLKIYSLCLFCISIVFSSRWRIWFQIFFKISLLIVKFNSVRSMTISIRKCFDMWRIKIVLISL